MAQGEVMTLRAKSLITVEAMAAILVAAFTLFVTIEPLFTKVEVNAAEIRGNSIGIQVNARDNKEILKLMIKATNSLSRVEGKVDAIISQGR
jgi:hypothetical protein